MGTSFASSGLAGMGGVSPVDFIAPSEHMKRLITLPYTPGRVAFPVHRVGNSLVIDGGVPRPGRAASSADGASAGAAAQKALEDVLGRMILGEAGMMSANSGDSTRGNVDNERAATSST